MEWSIKERWNTIESSNHMSINTWSPRRRRENENGTEALLKEILLENFQYQRKRIDPQILEAQQTHAGEIQRKLYIGI